MDRKNNIVPDAPESNAGDDFHILWGVRKSLELLNVDTFGLKAVAIEWIFSIWWIWSKKKKMQILKISRFLNIPNIL